MALAETRPASWDWERVEEVSISLAPVFCLIFLLTGIAMQMLGGPSGGILAVYMLAYLAGGSLAARTGILALLKRQLNVDLLMVLAALGAATIGAWEEGAVLLFLFSLSNALQAYALDRTRRAITALMDLRPDTATVLEEGAERRAPIDAVAVGQHILVRPGERLPLDGVVATGRTTIDQAPITGESVPAPKEVGAPVFAGTINQDGAITVRVTKPAGESTLARIVALVESARGNKARTERWLDAFEQRYAMIVILATLVAIALPPLLLSEAFEASFYRAMTLLVVASPCALVISTPAAVLSAIASAARQGVLFKGGVYLEAMADLKAVALDKTGTLTTGRPRVTDVAALDSMTDDEVLHLAASLERHSEHPIAAALVTAAGGRGLALAEPIEVRATPGRGLSGLVEGQPVLVGNPDLFAEAGRPLPERVLAVVERLQAEGKTAMTVANSHPLGVIAVADTPRPAAARVLDRLRALGVRRMVMLTGDNQKVADLVGRQLGVDEVRAELLPEEKAAVVAELVRAEGQVAMVGDGVNDAPALATASIGVAMGAAGTDVALETADVVLMGDDLSKLAFAMSLSRATRQIIIQNLSFAMLVIVTLIVATLSGHMTLPLGVLGHEGSTVLVVLNGLRLLLERDAG